MKNPLETAREYLKTSLATAVVVGAGLKPTFDFISEVLDML